MTLQSPDKPRILLVSHSLAGGGTDRVAVFLANGMAQSHPTALLVVREPEAQFALSALLDPKVTQLPCGQKRGGRAMDMILGLAPAIPLVRAFAPTHVMATGNNNSLFSLILHKLAAPSGAQFFVKVTNPIVRARDKGLKRWWRSFLYRRVFAACAGVLVLSPEEQAKLRADFPKQADKFHFVGNPYITNRFAALADERANASMPTTRHFVAIGRLHHQKNLPLLLDAWAKATLPNAHLTLVGEGPDRAALEAQIADLGIADSVTMAGYHTDIAPFLRGASALVLSSDYEGMPAVALEAMAVGCPLITTDSYPAAGSLAALSNACQLVPVRDRDALTQALQAAIHHDWNVPDLAAATAPYEIDTAIAAHLAAMNCAR